MKKLALLSMLALSVALAGCDQKTKITDGQVPNELLPYVQKFVGDYHGQFQHDSVGMSMKLEGNRLILSSTGDLVAPACETKIGNLLEVYTTEKDKVVTVTRAVFALDPNLCANEVVGRQLTINFASQEPLTFDIEYLDHYEQRQHCDYVTNPPPYTGPVQQCYYDNFAIYNEGRVVKN